MKAKIIITGLFAISTLICIKGQQNASWYANSISTGLFGTDCTAFGFNALSLCSSSNQNNTGLGYKVMNGLVLGEYNTAIGAYALNTNGLSSTFNVLNSQNTAIGHSALFSNGEGYENTATGYYALYSNVQGCLNTALGKEALFSNINGWCNTASGYQALYKSGINPFPLIEHNTATGHKALYSNDEGQGNTATGKDALSSNTFGEYNTAMGYQSLNTNSSSFGIAGSKNTAVGKSSMSSNVSGSYNTAVGVEALYSNYDGIDNVALGYGAGYDNTVGNDNVCIGHQSSSGTTGSQNVVIGANAFSQNASSYYNTIVGHQAFYSSFAGPYTGGGSNTLLGEYALWNVVPGDECTFLGASSSMSSGGNDNAVAIGYQAIVNAPDKMWLGNTSVNQIESVNAILQPSDGRFKTNISEKDVVGLEFIKRLRPVVYNFDTEKFTKFLTKNMTDSLRKTYLNHDFTINSSVRQSGFIAQEVEKAASEVGYNFNGVRAPKDENGNYGIAYALFVVPLVKAVQEQQQMIDEQKQFGEELLKLNEDQEKRLAELQEKINSTTSIELNENTKDEFTMWAQPNPFLFETIINYVLPVKIESAYLTICNTSGKQVAQYPITQKGTSSITITSENLNAGVYIYSIIGEGKILGSKRLVVAGK